ncbi:MAG TPA: endonuclease/exonuclease/phosphatase family protein [Acidimicrobiales bacterium]|nr:endonuclease/exonuclease/phosphatase family protein [Acidimicrobiales bacterium]
MPEPFDLSRPPKAVTDDVARLGAALDEKVPRKRLDHNLLIATWNIRAFGDLTEAWQAPPDASPKRDYHALACIAEIVSRFDVIGIQEVRGNLKALRHLLKLLGPDWSFVLTDVTRGKPGNDERMAFLFDTRRARMSGLACELVLPADYAEGVEQFARTPYAVSFLSAGRDFKATFILVTLHVLYGKRKQDRTPELAAIAKWVEDMALDVNAYDQNLLVLGDFNTDRRDDPNYQALMSTDLWVPPELHEVPRTISSNDPTANHYDQIAWFNGEGKAPALSLTYAGQAGCVNFVDVVFADLDTNDLSWKMSDHLPLWVEFLV